MRRILSLFLLACTAIAATAQVQQGYVRTIERPGHPKQALGGVAVKVRGIPTRALSAPDGTFSIHLTEQVYQLQSVQKQGYELVDRAAIGQRYGFSASAPLTIVMVSTQQLEADRQRIQQNAERVAEQNYQKRVAELERKKAEAAITAEQYHRQLIDLEDKYERYQSLIGDMADRYARTDYEGIDEVRQRISQCIENGELDTADSLIRSITNVATIVERNRAAKTEIASQRAVAQQILRQADQKEEAVRRQELLDAEDLYNLYTIAVAHYQNDSAAYYIETRAELDTTNVIWQSQAGSFMDYVANFPKALDYFHRALRHAIALYGEEHGDIIKIYHSIGNIYNTLGRYQQALAYLQKAVDLHHAIYGDSNSSVAGSYTNMGSIHAQMGEFDKALELQQKALDIMLADPKYNKSNQAVCYVNIGYVYGSQGKYAKSLDYFLRAYDLLRSVHDDQGRDFALISNNIGAIYFRQGDNAKALEYYRQAMELQQKLFGPNHPDVALTYNNIGMIYGRQQQYAQAIDYFQKSANAYSALVGDHHLIVAYGYDNISDAYFCLGDTARAAEYDQRAQAIYAANFSEQHSDVALRYNKALFCEYQLVAADSVRREDFLSDIAFTATFMPGSDMEPGIYWLLELNDWSESSPVSLFDLNEGLHGKPKTLVVMKDGQITKRHFATAVGARFDLTRIGRAAKQRISKAYRKWKEGD